MSFKLFYVHKKKYEPGKFCENFVLQICHNNKLFNLCQDEPCRRHFGSLKSENFRFYVIDCSKIQRIRKYSKILRGRLRRLGEFMRYARCVFFARGGARTLTLSAKSATDFPRSLTVELYLHKALWKKVFFPGELLSEKIVAADGVS